MMVRRVSVVLSGRDLESLLEGIERQEGHAAECCSRGLPGVEAPDLWRRRAELLRLQAACVEAFAAGVDLQAEPGEFRPGPPESATAAVCSPAAGPRPRVDASVDPARMLSASEVAIPLGVWSEVCRLLAVVQVLMECAMADGPVDNGKHRKWLRDVEALRRKWDLSCSC
jgi:hypothetical protein